MITVRRAGERAFEERRTRASWLSFPSQARGDTIIRDFGSFDVLEESRLPPHSVDRRPFPPAEIITYVHKGRISYEDSVGRAGLLSTGDFQRMTVTDGIHYDEVNASPVDWAHVYQVYLKPPLATNLTSGHEQRHFTMAERRGHLCVVASPNPRGGALKLHHDAYLYSAILGPGQRTTHPLPNGRVAWLQIVEGAVSMDAQVLEAGDGVGVSEELTVSWTTHGTAEVLLLDLGSVETAEVLKDAQSRLGASQ